MPATANPKLAAAMREIARSNASGTHANKATRRRRTRAGAKAAALRDFR